MVFSIIRSEPKQKLMLESNLSFSSVLGLTQMPAKTLKVTSSLPYSVYIGYASCIQYPQMPYKWRRLMEEEKLLHLYGIFIQYAKKLHTVHSLHRNGKRTIQ